MTEPETAAKLLGDEHEQLLEFLYQCPVGIARFDARGDVAMINSMAAQLLLPLAEDGQLDNLLDVFGRHAPELRRQVEAYDRPRGTVCEGLRVDVRRVGWQVGHLGVTIVKIDANRWMGVVQDVTQIVAQEQALLRVEESVLRAKVQEGLAIAKRVQTSILPTSFVSDGYEIAAVMEAADEIGGDYYDLLTTTEAHWLAIGDVSGHGVDAGLVMLMVQSAMAAIIRSHSVASPREMVASLNTVLFDNIRERLRQRDHVTFTLFRLARDGGVVFAGAHEDIILRRASTGAIERIGTPGTWLGAKRDIRNVTFDSGLRLEPDDLMVLYTDGITEARNASGAMFDLDGLCAAIAEVGDEPCAAIRDHVMGKVRRWMTQQDDDMSLVVVRRRPSSTS